MNLAKLKAKNQVTLPNEIVKKLNLKPEELFQVEVEKNNILLIPVEVKPKYTKIDLEKIDKITKREKKYAKSRKAGKEFSKYIDRIK
jgi:AbrB family looped-hinge helix DNA binding protein